MKASDLFVRCLEAEGVTHIFGLPGEENADLMISLLDSKIQFVLCRHEQAAAFIADVYGRLTGKAGVCLATLGPGATNLITGVADANMDRAPLGAITGQADTRRLHKESHQAMDVIGMITNNGYVDGHIFRDLRQHLVDTYGTVRVLNLHGDTRKKEKTATGSADKNVFDIMQGVAILVLARRPGMSAADVHYADLWGEREGKYAALRNPREIVPGSVMPKYSWLHESKLDTSLTKKKMEVLRKLGVPYSDADIEGAKASIESQAQGIAGRLVEQKVENVQSDREIVALIAYLQRLGGDIHWREGAQ